MNKQSKQVTELLLSQLEIGSAMHDSDEHSSLQSLVQILSNTRKTDQCPHCFGRGLTYKGESCSYCEGSGV